MVASAEHSWLTINAYLTLEQTSLERHEYVAGQVYAMAGGSEEHDLIAGNFYTRLRSHLRGQGCRVFSGNMKIYIAKLDIFYYPDLSVICDPADTERYFKERPQLLIEVLSPSTARIDRNEKLINYRQIESLEEYVLVSQTEAMVEVYRRGAAGAWVSEVLKGDGAVRLTSVGLTLTLAEIYEDVILG
jgi:Uma2 family endonuclease